MQAISFVSGLWQVCFQGFVDPRHWYETEFYGCWWVFEEEYYIIHDILLPGKKHELQFFLRYVPNCDLVYVYSKLFSLSWNFPVVNKEFIVSDGKHIL